MIIDFLTLIGLGFTDALNPFSIAAMAYLLAMDRPLERGLIFIVGTIFIYFPGGVALMEGWSAILQNILPLFPEWLPVLLHFVCGLFCIAAAFYFYRRARDQGGRTAPMLGKLSLTATFMFALGSTISDLPTALPYFAGATIIANAGEGFLIKFSLLAVYNLIYISPLVFMLAIRMSAGAYTQVYLTKVRSAIDCSFAHLFPSTIGLIGFYLLARGIWIAGDV